MAGMATTRETTTDAPASGVDDRLARELQRVESSMREAVGDCSSGAVPCAAVEHLASGGGRFRARLALGAGAALGLRPPLRIALACSVELIHNASLIHDDLVDRDVQRRARPAVWVSHGPDRALCAGDLLLSAAYAALARSGPDAPMLLELTHRRVRDLINGQGADIGFRPGGDTTVADYERIAAGKSGPLMSLPIEMCLMSARRWQALDTAQRCAEAFAVGYQIFDDLADAPGDRRRGALNIVSVLSDYGYADPAGQAAWLCDEWLCRAEGFASQLPASCGQQLEGAARRLRGRLVPCRKTGP